MASSRRRTEKIRLPSCPLRCIHFPKGRCEIAAGSLTGDHHGDWYFLHSIYNPRPCAGEANADSEGNADIDARNRAERNRRVNKQECAKVLADSGETPESLQPAVIELAKVLVAKLRAGTLGQ